MRASYTSHYASCPSVRVSVRLSVCRNVKPWPWPCHPRSLGHGNWPWARNLGLVRRFSSTVCSGLLSLLPFAGRKMSSGLRSTGWRPIVWLNGAVVCLWWAASRVQLFVTPAMGGSIMRHGINSSCQSAATSEIVKRLWSRVWLM